MKNLLLLLILLVMGQICKSQNQGPTCSFGSEYIPYDVCMKASNNQFAMDISVAESNLEQIYSKLNFNEYKIEVLKCNSIGQSALAYFDKNTSKRYILINQDKLTDLNNRYFSHMFVIAHEFSHYSLGQMDGTKIYTLSEKRNCELLADKSSASLIKKLGGKLEDCTYALNQMVHPADDSYSDHPTKEKRIAAVQEGFGIAVTDNHPQVIKPAYTNYFNSFTDVALLKFSGDVKAQDISDYYYKNGMIPKSIIYYDNSYWVYCEKNNTDYEGYSIMWSYDDYPKKEIDKRFKDGYNIDFIEKINSKWFVVFVKYKKSFDQITQIIDKDDFINMKGDYIKKIEPVLDDNYSIQNLISFDGNSYLIFLTKIDGISGYSWASKKSYKDFKDWYIQEKAEGYNYLFCHKFIDNAHFGFMQKQQGVKNWVVSNFDGKNISEIIGNLDKGYVIDNIVVDDYVRFTFKK